MDRYPPIYGSREETVYIGGYVYIGGENKAKELKG